MQERRANGFVITDIRRKGETVADALRRLPEFKPYTRGVWPWRSEVKPILPGTNTDLRFATVLLEMITDDKRHVIVQAIDKKTRYLMKDADTLLRGEYDEITVAAASPDLSRLAVISRERGKLMLHLVNHHTTTPVLKDEEGYDELSIKAHTDDLSRLAVISTRDGKQSMHVLGDGLDIPVEGEESIELLDHSDDLNYFVVKAKKGDSFAVHFVQYDGSKKTPIERAKGIEWVQSDGAYAFGLTTFDDNTELQVYDEAGELKNRFAVTEKIQLKDISIYRYTDDFATVIWEGYDGQRYHMYRNQEEIVSSQGAIYGGDDEIYLSPDAKRAIVLVFADPRGRSKIVRDGEILLDTQLHIEQFKVSPQLTYAVAVLPNELGRVNLFCIGPGKTYTEHVDEVTNLEVSEEGIVADVIDENSPRRFIIKSDDASVEEPSATVRPLVLA